MGNILVNNSGYITTGPEFRFLMRDGEKVLQKLEHRSYSDHHESVWVDVPTVTE